MLATKGAVGIDIATIKKHAVGGMMNREEAKMNKALLQEIALTKKENL